MSGARISPDGGIMYWFSNIVDVGNETMILISYFHINPDTKRLEVHTKISKDEDEFRVYYNKIKCL